MYMDNLRKTVGENLANLRKEKKLTQLELAEKFNYSDKAVSKWETGETLPELDVLYQLCEFYGVTLDYLTHEGNKDAKKEFTKKNADVNSVAITCLIASVVWMIATIIFVYLLLINKIVFWEVFIWAIPVTAVVLLFANHAYYKSRVFRFVSYSVFVWGLIASVFFTVQAYTEQVIWPLFIVGVPMQVSLTLWFVSKKK